LKTKTKREKSTTTTGHYVRNADLLPAVIEAKAKGEVTERLIKMVWMIADRYSKKGSFVNLFIPS
jgi:exosome complex RNA-binding protein Rrp42 (RNase PH superfamily)